MVPCEGIFVDVKELPSENVTAVNEELLFERYKNYKHFYEPWLFDSNTYFKVLKLPNTGLSTIPVFL